MKYRKAKAISLTQEMHSRAIELLNIYAELMDLPVNTIANDVLKRVLPRLIEQQKKLNESEN